MLKCNHITKKNTRCGRTASFRINCKLLCWQHAKYYKMFVKKGDKCNFKLLQKFDTIRKPFLGLGIAGRATGISGSISVQSIFKVFNAMYERNACLLDVGAADGYVLFLAIIYGYRESTGIEFQSGAQGLRNIFETLWTKLLTNAAPGIFNHDWSRKKPSIHYNTNISTMKEELNDMRTSGKTNIHIYTFWDSFANKDSNSLMKKIKGQNVTRGCFVCRRSRRFGTFDKLQKEFSKYDIHVEEITSIEATYRSEKYNAIVVKF